MLVCNFNNVNIKRHKQRWLWLVMYFSNKSLPNQHYWAVFIASIHSFFHDNSYWRYISYFVSIHIVRLCLYLQVVNAANVLADRPNSKAARDNLKEFLDAWSYQVEMLTAAVDDITTIDDFLSATGKSPLLGWCYYFLYSFYVLRSFFLHLHLFCRAVSVFSIVH